jgi:AraC family transcriptional regulator
MDTPLLINPSAEWIGKANLVISGTGRSYYVRDFEGSLSIKTVIAGSATWFTSGRSFTVQENCWLVLNDRQRYSMEIETREPTRTFCLFFERGFVEDVQRTMTTPASKLVDDADVDLDYRGFFEALEPSSSPVCTEVRRFRHDLLARKIGARQWQDRFIEIGRQLALAQRHALSDAARAGAVKASTRIELARRVRRGRNLLLSSRSRPIALKEAAREACMSPYHFHRTFRQLFGQTPHEFVTHYRVQRAAHDLCHTRKSVTEICFENGFESLPSFSALFRKRLGMSPTRLRQVNGQIAEIRKIG